MELIKLIANKVVIDLRARGDNTYKEMDAKLGQRFLKEMDSIKLLCNYIKYFIENKNKIKRELTLEQDEFIIDDVSLFSFQSKHISRRLCLIVFPKTRIL